MADNLELARTTHKYHNLILVVPGHFFGLMKKHMDGNVLSTVRTVIEKDYTKIPALRLTKYLKEHFLSM